MPFRAIGKMMGGAVSQEQLLPLQHIASGEERVLGAARVRREHAAAETQQRRRA